MKRRGHNKRRLLPFLFKFFFDIKQFARTRSKLILISLIILFLVYMHEVLFNLI